ncbi:hypothetical protein BD779DRAFT_1454428, partial [Infundibulicybe gibba]
YIAAGYTGHGMPRAFAWYVIGTLMLTFDISKRGAVSAEWLPDHYLTWNRSNKRA